jgi:endo-1,3(4)-beta-glucanase
MITKTPNGIGLVALTFVCTVLQACGGGSSPTSNTPPPTANTAPVLHSQPSLTADTGTAYEYVMLATDADGDPVSYAATSLPDWLSFDAGAGLLSGMPALENVGSHPVALTYTDGTDSRTLNFTIVVTRANAAPVLQSQPAITAVIDSPYTYTLLATDADPGDVVSYSATTLPGWLSFDAATGLLAGTPVTSDAGLHSVALAYTDGIADNTLTFTITVSHAVSGPVDPSDPSTFALTSYGAGTVSDGINPDGYGCVYDYGTWIYNAGIVEPGVGSCNPIGAPTPLHPQLVSPAADGPTPTHKWWGSIPFMGEMEIGNPNKAAYITPDPFTARISNKGARLMSIPSGLRLTGDGFLYQVPDPFSEVFDGIAVGNTGNAYLNAYLKDHSDGSVTVQWQDGSQPVMEATFVHGSPYVYFKSFTGDLVIRTLRADGPEKGIFYAQGNSLGVWTDVAGIRNNFLITGEGATQFSNTTSNEITVSNASGELTLAYLPSAGGTIPDNAMTQFFASYARNLVRQVDIDYAVDRNDNSVTVNHSYRDASGALVETVAGMQPLHWKNSSQAVSGYQVRSARGIIKFTQAGQYSYRLPFVGVLPYLPSTAGSYDQATLEALVTEFVSTNPATWNTETNTYWAGKNYGKVAELAALSHSIGMAVESDKLIAWLKAELSDWFTADTNGTLDTNKYFVYDDEWNTLLGLEEAFASHQQLNDHHFHYGYFVRAAAEICRVDAAWCGANQYGPMIELLIRDYAAGRNDPLFPYLRNFDPANGFSWASGNANFVQGNNNESTSEAANAYGAIILYGLITGKNELVERGMYLHASTTGAYWEYWNNIDAYRGAPPDFDNFPAGYGRLTTSIIWGQGGVFATWFSPAIAHILGIQGLPSNTLNLHIGQHPDYLVDYVSLGLSESSNARPSGLANDQWKDLWWNIWAMTDAAAAIADYDTVGSSYQPEFGESKAHTYQWLHAFSSLGHLSTGTGTLTSNSPAALAFENNGATTYVAYNFTGQVQAIQFSDGKAFNAEPYGFTIVNETP